VFPVLRDVSGNRRRSATRRASAVPLFVVTKMQPQYLTLSMCPVSCLTRVGNFRFCSVDF
jgi:hypothetical protein